MSRPRQGRSATTRSTLMPRSRMASRIVPEPDTKTASEGPAKLKGLDDLDHLLAGFGRIETDVHAGFAEGLHFGLGRSLRAGDDRARVSHLSSRRRGDAGDVA